MISNRRWRENFKENSFFLLTKTRRNFFRIFRLEQVYGTCGDRWTQLCFAHLRHLLPLLRLERANETKWIEEVDNIDWVELRLESDKIIRKHTPMTRQYASIRRYFYIPLRFRSMRARITKKERIFVGIWSSNDDRKRQEWRRFVLMMVHCVLHPWDA